MNSNILADPPTDECSLPLMIGTCNQDLDKWFFDGSSRTCQRFKYGGCDANLNNFETRESCEAKCGSPIVYVADTTDIYESNYEIPL